VFNVLTSLRAVEGATVVDLFAGTGALGIEALSRGAAHVTFVDRDPAAAATIRDNLAAVGLAGASSEVVRAEVLAWLEHGRPHEHGRPGRSAHKDGRPGRSAHKDGRPGRSAHKDGGPGRSAHEAGDRAFDLALCDPPYDFTAWARLLNGLSAELAVLESSVPLEAPAGWMVRTAKRYGGTVVTLVQPLPHQVARKGAS
jgi:16S rRNA G966 N2-methylase RsmD